MITNIYTPEQSIMLKLKVYQRLKKFEEQSVAAKAKRLSTAGID
jgi:hypothetical protein